MPRLVVFDLDGTLSDSREAILRTFEAACLDHGVAAPSDAAVAAMIGLPLDHMFETLAPPPAAPLVQTYKDRYVEFDRLHTRLFPGVLELLQGLEPRLALATSKLQQGAERSLERAGITQLFDVIMGHCPSRRPKPHPDMLLEVLRQAGVSRDDAVMVGDTTYDLEMADAAGVRAIGVAWGHHEVERLSRWPLARDAEHLRRLILEPGS